MRRIPAANEKNHFGEDNWRYVDMPIISFNLPSQHWMVSHLMKIFLMDCMIRHCPAGMMLICAGMPTGVYLRAELDLLMVKIQSCNFIPMEIRMAILASTKNWKETIHAPGAEQMQYLKKLMLSKSYFDRIPAQEIIADNTENQYNYILATKGKNYAMVYTYTGKNFKVDLSKLKFTVSKLSWFNPSDGTL